LFGRWISWLPHATRSTTRVAISRDASRFRSSCPLVTTPPPTPRP